MLKAALFDMDGLLFDTESLGIEVGIEVGCEMGFPVTAAMGRALLGVNETESTAYLRTFFPTLDGKAFWRRYAEKMKAHVSLHGTPLKTGCVQIIRTLCQQRFPCALASSSSRHVIDFYLAHSPLEGCFPVIVSGDLGLRSKPAPDVFLRAAQEMQVAPRECAVLEDSLNGLKAGRAAGMHTIMVPDIVPYSPQHAGLCDFVAPTLHEACAHILEGACSTL